MTSKEITLMTTIGLCISMTIAKLAGADTITLGFMFLCASLFFLRYLEYKDKEE